MNIESFSFQPCYKPVRALHALGLQVKSLLCVTLPPHFFSPFSPSPSSPFFLLSPSLGYWGTEDQIQVDT